MFIIGVLKEELENSIRARDAFIRAMEKLPQGSLVRKVIGGHPYYYLAQRDGGKVRFNYVGKLNVSELKRYGDAKKFRIRYRRQISEIDKQIKFIKKIINGQKSA